jgi:hypothetical protein
MKEYAIISAETLESLVARVNRECAGGEWETLDDWKELSKRVQNEVESDDGKRMIIPQFAWTLVKTHPD